VSLLLPACGGGGGGTAGGGGESVNPGNFALDLDPNTLVVAAGGSASTSISVVPSGGFSAQVSVQVSGLPNGVTISPAKITVSPGTPVFLTISATAGTATSDTTIAFTGASSGISQQTSLGLTVEQINTAPVPSRTKYIRTDAVTEYWQWLNTHWIVYHSATSHFFVTDPLSNQIFVIDAATRTRIGSIVVPGAYSVDLTPDQSKIYVGTLIGDVYVVDPVAMQVTNRYEAQAIGLPAMTALVLSNGQLALLGVAQGIAIVDGSMNMAIFDPTTGTSTVYGTGMNAADTPLCGDTGPLHLFAFELTADRTSVVTNAGTAATSLCELNVLTGQSITVVPSGSGAPVISPDGKYVAIPVYPSGIQLLDQKTLNPVTQFNLTAETETLGDATIRFSPDSSILYVGTSSFVDAYNVAAQQLAGWIPNIVVEPTEGGLGSDVQNPHYGAFDTTGMIVGPLEEGVGFLDTTTLQTGPHGVGFLNGYLNPATGPVSGGTETQWSAPLPSAVYFGQTPAAFVPGNGDLLNVTAPAGQPGPVDGYLFLTDGEMLLIPEAYSYGPTILEVTPNSSTAEGGGAGVVYGYGFGAVDGSGAHPGLSVSVGGQVATVTGFNANAYGTFSPPFQLQAVYYTIPAGTANSAADVTVTSSSGNTTAEGGMQYLPALKTYPLAGASLAQGVYDPLRDVYYFTDTNKVQVFSLTQGAWLSPITIPAPQGATQRLWGLGLSPDGSKLAVADSQADVVYLLDPSNPTAIQTFAIKPTFPISQGAQVLPAGVAVTNSGMVWLTVEIYGGTGYHNFYTLDTTTGALTDLGIDGPGKGASDLNLRTILSADGSQIFFDDDGYVFGYVTATNSFFSATQDAASSGNYDLAVAANESQVEASNYLYDFSLAAAATLTLNDREAFNVAYVYGDKMSPDGALLFQPSTQGMDIFDGKLGILRSRIAFSVPVSTNYDALVSDGKDDLVIVITGTSGDGIAVLDLSSFAEAALKTSSQQAYKREPAVKSEAAVGTRIHEEIKRQTPVGRVPHIVNSAFFHK
jgi:hypothetical protein